MPASQSDRARLEKAIVVAARSIHEDETTKCLDTNSIEEFLAAWREPVTYFERNEDTSIGVEVVREYLDRLMIFSTVWHNESRPSDCREMAQEACEELELYMNDIIKAVNTRLYPTGREHEM